MRRISAKQKVALERQVGILKMRLAGEHLTRCAAATLATSYRPARQCEKRVPRGARLCAHHLSMPAARVTIWKPTKENP